MKPITRGTDERPLRAIFNPHLERFSIMPRFICLSREDDSFLYDADTLSQAKGFSDGCEIPCRITAELDTLNAVENLYRICAVDAQTGQTVMSGPIVELYEAADCIGFLKLVLVPVGVEQEVNNDAR